MNKYTGTVNRADCNWQVTVNGAALAQRQDLRNHSPTGFAWGYGGSGPAQTALAILAHELGDLFALAAYQDFKFAHVARWPQDEPFEIDGDTIREWFQEWRSNERNAKRLERLRHEA